ncbi:MAG: cation-translocating P-type ATPase [Chitinophagaceae bacterium]|nr:MAG: cation-translocating P-type ATPase [Chitinophagaceae bacterium]
MQYQPSNKYLGLNKQLIPGLIRQYGGNVVSTNTPGATGKIIRAVIGEPMFILLLISCVLYFILQKNYEGIMMLAAMSVVTGISLFQEFRSRKALNALKHLTDPRCKVIRDGLAEDIPPAELVPGDVILLSEGMRVPADAHVLEENDLTVNESVLTGESLPAEKSASGENNRLFQGSIINSGQCIARVELTGNRTMLGVTGKYVSEQRTPRSRLQKQASRFVTRLAIFGLAGFAILLIANLVAGSSFAQSLLISLTLAMAVAPEEIPVALSSFMALGAFRLSQQGIITRQPYVIESLGAVSVICFDKTGTITENKMHVNGIYHFGSKILYEPSVPIANEAGEILRYAALASELQPYDTMEHAIWETAIEIVPGIAKTYNLTHGYALSGIPPMMTHVHIIDGQKLVVAKGAVERAIAVSGLSEIQKAEILDVVVRLAEEGNRIIAVLKSTISGDNYPQKQDDFEWTFAGLISLSDPPKKNAKSIILQLQRAGIQIKMITGDHPQTASRISRQVSIHNPGIYMTGNDVLKMEMSELQVKVASVNVFTRMFPEAKLKVIEALKANGETVAMTGDGINDGAALKSAHVGIAMGKKGTEMAMLAADLILTDDNLRKIITAVKQGRKIFSNLQKAIGYIISIHIPIILTAAIPVLLNWKYPNIFTPVHVIFLEIIMGPTCSIFFENEPAEKNLSGSFSAKYPVNLLPRRKMITSIIQGLVIATGTLGLCYYFMQQGHSLPYTRTVVFDSLMISNIFLTFVSRSNEHTIFKTIRYHNILAPFLMGISALYFIAINNVTVLQQIFGLETLRNTDMIMTIVIAMLSVIWIEFFKTFNHSRVGTNKPAVS